MRGCAKWSTTIRSQEHDLYALATDVLVHLHRHRRWRDCGFTVSTSGSKSFCCSPTGIARRSGSDVDRDAFIDRWRSVLEPVATDGLGPVTVLRDYHAENIMLVEGRDGVAHFGLLDFQDALSGHPAYDLASVLEDARRDVDPAIEHAMIDRYVAATGNGR